MEKVLTKTVQGIKQVYSPNGGLPTVLGQYLPRDTSDSNKDFGQEIRD
jgi:hypothetical protein